MQNIEWGSILILSIIEGLTEFIPVSSTGHLLLTSDILGFNSPDGTFEIAIQLGAISAVVVYYRQFFRSLIQTNDMRTITHLLCAALPVLILGFLAYDVIKLYLFNPFSIALSLIVGSVLMIIAERKKNTSPQQINQLTVRSALTIGLWQCLALWPGMSRSGATICGGLFAKMDHQNSAKFSFILGVPVIGAAVGYDLLKSWDKLSTTMMLSIGVGSVLSFFISLIAIRFFLVLLDKTKLLPFAVYRMILAIGIIIVTI